MSGLIRFRPLSRFTGLRNSIAHSTLPTPVQNYRSHWTDPKSENRLTSRYADRELRYQLKRQEEEERRQLRKEDQETSRPNQSKYSWSWQIGVQKRLRKIDQKRSRSPGLAEHVEREYLELKKYYDENWVDMYLGRQGFMNPGSKVESHVLRFDDMDGFGKILHSLLTL
ncbi:hypothetical protein FGRMN_5276 [Fusarium graminum]|nr:hypothetical protein FGRMN_5276 [Fusarium graminum]